MTGKTRASTPFSGLVSRKTTPLGGADSPAARLMEFLPDVYYFVKNRRSEFVAANRQFVEMLGASRLEDILGKRDHDFSPKKLADAFVRDDRRVMATGREMANRVEPVPNADGSISWHVTSKVPLRDAAGRITGVAGVTRDLKKASRTLRRFRFMSEVLDRLEADCASPITVGEMAALAHLSVSQFERRFKAVFNLTPVQYLVKLRVNKACRLLRDSEAKISRIACECGFYDHSHFIRVFTRVMGMPPLAYRRERRET